MAFGSLSLSKFRSKKEKVAGNDGDKTANHNTPGSSNSQSTTPPPPVVVKSGQKHPAGEIQAHPITIDEARDELTTSLRSKSLHSGLTVGSIKDLESNFM